MSLRPHEDARTELRAEVDRVLMLRSSDAQEDKLHAQAVAATKCQAGIADNRSAWPNREARQALAEAAAAAAAKAEAERAARETQAENRKRSGPVPRALKEPDPQTQRNFTDPDSACC